jgi:hypothetical protein
MTLTFDRGDAQRLSMTFLGIDDIAADPSSITVIITEPDGEVVSYDYGVDAELIKESVGNYYVDYTFTKKGRHQVRFEGVGGVTSAEQTDVYIRA